MALKLWEQAVELPPSLFLNNSREVVEVVVTGRWFQFLMVQGKKELFS